LGAPASRPTAEWALARARAASDEWAIAYALGMLALHEAYAGDYGRAAELWTDVYELVRHGGDRALEARALSNLGAAYQYLGQFEQARHYLEQGLVLCDLIGDRHGHAYIVGNLGGVMLLSGDLAAAKPLLEQGLSEAQLVDDAALCAANQWELGHLAELLGDHTNAARHLHEAHRIDTELGLTARVIESKALLAKCALHQGRHADALEAAGQVWAYLHDHGAATMDEAVLTYLAIADVCAALAHDPTVPPFAIPMPAIIRAGYELVMARAERISDPAWRRSFLEKVPSNRAMIERWGRTP
ncbi:MAG TPA: tetratricopeptide repeat protein, partial [Kouleothrix sp.]|nr:tetratricopeptide repeat protein [Kouleothrix sp.]